VGVILIAEVLENVIVDVTDALFIIAVSARNL
jgi:hypothetical protein